jgi:hypothetical protein
MRFLIARVLHNQRCHTGVAGPPGECRQRDPGPLGKDEAQSSGRELTHESAGFLRVVALQVPTKKGKGPAAPEPKSRTIATCPVGTSLKGTRIQFVHAARQYSWSNPPRRSQRFTTIGDTAANVAVAGRPFGGARFKLR